MFQVSQLSPLQLVKHTNKMAQVFAHLCLIASYAMTAYAINYLNYVGLYLNNPSKQLKIKYLF